MYSILAVVAFFTAVILDDVFWQKREDIPPHALLGLISTGIITTLWFYDLEFVGWALLILPITALTVSFLVLYAKSYSGSTVALPAPVQPKPAHRHHTHHKHHVRHKNNGHDSWQEMFQHVETKRDDNKYNVPPSSQIPSLLPAVYSDVKGNPNGDKHGVYTEPC